MTKSLDIFDNKTSTEVELEKENTTSETKVLVDETLEYKLQKFKIAKNIELKIAALFILLAISSLFGMYHNVEYAGMVLGFSLLMLWLQLTE